MSGINSDGSHLLNSCSALFFISAKCDLLQMELNQLSHRETLSKLIDPLWDCLCACVRVCVCVCVSVTATGEAGGCLLCR